MNRNKKIIQKIVLGGVIVNQDNKILILQRNKSKKISEHFGITKRKKRIVRKF